MTGSIHPSQMPSSAKAGASGHFVGLVCCIQLSCLAVTS